ncbi:MAG: DUF6089 family protein [Flavobacteriaceae bacterium]
MKRFLRQIILLALLFYSRSVSAQRYELGIMGGGANMIGDVGSTQYINPDSPAAGILFRWNNSMRYAWRASLIHSNLRAEDQLSSDLYRQSRNYSVTNRLTALSLGLEFNHLKFNLHRFGGKWSPYLFSGVTTYHAHAQRGSVFASVPVSQEEWGLAVPVGIGVKWRPKTYLVFGLESTLHATFTDNLDGSNPKNDKFADLNPGDYFGNPNSQDWFLWTGLILTYTFGQKPCVECYK